MSAKTITIAVVGLIIVFIVALLVFLNLSESMEREAAYEKLIEDGFMYLSEQGNEESMDTAIRYALDAQEIFPDRKEPLVILGCAYNEKGNHRKAEEIFLQGLDDLGDVDYYAELSYHLGITYSLLYNQLKKEDLLNSAVSAFTEGAASGYHMADAYFGIGALYFDLYLQNLTPYLKEKVLVNFQRCMDIEADMDGYVPGEPDSICPLCRRSFTKKTDQEKFIKLIESLGK